MDTQIKFREKVGYGLGDAASSMFWKLFGSYLLFFYTDIFGLPAAAVGTMFLITRDPDTPSAQRPRRAAADPARSHGDLRMRGDRQPGPVVRACRFRRRARGGNLQEQFDADPDGHSAARV